MDYDQLKYRKFLGPTQFATAIGYDYFQTSEQLRHEIENGYKLKSNHAIDFGVNYESVALYYYAKLFKVKIDPATFKVDPKNPRIGGKADGLIGDDCGIEIKCHVGTDPLRQLTSKYLIQTAGYMFLYNRPKWIIFSCTFNTDNTLAKYRIFEITWEHVKGRWERDWYPRINKFMKYLKWVNLNRYKHSLSKV